MCTPSPQRQQQQRNQAQQQRKKAVVVVTPYSTGCVVAHEMQKRGCAIIALWIQGFAEEMKTHVPLSCKGQLKYYAEVEEQDSLEETMQAVRDSSGDMEIVACLAGGEAGVDVADALSEAMGLLTNGTDIANRRDKKVQQELLRSAGMRSVRQAGSDKFEDVEDFLRKEKYPVVLKPTESAGSDGVKLCPNFDEAKEHFELLMNSQMVNGGMCGQVLCQEFLKGKEYVVDHVSLNGVHKTMMVWVYDKRERNGSAFVYFGLVPIEADSLEAQLIIPYVRQTLDVLGVKNGPSHGEVIITADGPCLVEMNCRASGGDGGWVPLCRGLTGGYSQVDATVDCYLSSSSSGERDFVHKYPDKPGRLIGQGAEVCLVSYGKGKVRATPGFDILKKLPSCIQFESSVRIGSQVELTVNLITCVGMVIVWHESSAVVQDDLHFIRYLENMNGLFLFEEEEEPTILTPKWEEKQATVAREAKELQGEPELNNPFPDSPQLDRTISLQRTIDLDTALAKSKQEEMERAATAASATEKDNIDEADRFFGSGPSMIRTVSLQKTLRHRNSLTSH